MECDKLYDKRLNKDLIKRFENTQRLFDGDANEFFLMFQKVLVHTNTSIARKDSA